MPSTRPAMAERHAAPTAKETAPTLTRLGEIEQILRNQTGRQSALEYTSKQLANSLGEEIQHLESGLTRQDHRLASSGNLMMTQNQQQHQLHDLAQTTVAALQAAQSQVQDRAQSTVAAQKAV